MKLFFWIKNEVFFFLFKNSEKRKILQFWGKKNILKVAKAKFDRNNGLFIVLQ